MTPGSLTIPPIALEDARGALKHAQCNLATVQQSLLTAWREGKEGKNIVGDLAIAIVEGFVALDECGTMLSEIDGTLNREVTR